MKRRDFLLKSSSALAAALTGCGGSSEASDQLAANSQVTPPASGQSAPSSSAAPIAAAPSSAPGGLPLLTLHSSKSGTYPYLATVYPLEGAVPNGRVIVSDNDLNLRSSVLSTWPDGSASVMVVAGEHAFAEANSTANISLRHGLAQGDALTPAYIDSLITTLEVNFSGTPRTFSNWTSGYDRIWWANAAVICARYRLSCGLGDMEAVIDVHAFAGGRAFVEVVIENCKINMAALAEPLSQNYTNATVSVNGMTIQTVSSANGPNTTHSAWRAWYCSTWVGGDPGLQVTHDTAHLQSHPWFWKAARPVTANMQSAWGGDYYTPLSVGARLPKSGMGGTGEGGPRATWIGQLPPWDADYICTGNKYAAQASINNALCQLTFTINYRYSAGASATNLVPTNAELYRYAKRNAASPTFPQDTYQNDGSQKAWFDDAHQPAGPLVAFLCRPSPVFIELAQKSAAWNCTENTRNGVRSGTQVRTRAWSARNYSIAAFLSPDGSAHKTALRDLLKRCAQNVFTYSQDPQNTLDFVYNDNARHFIDVSSTRPKGQDSIWMHHWLACVYYTTTIAKILRGAEATAWNTTTDWLLKQPVRYVNEASGGEWRLHNYLTTVSDTTATWPIAMRSTWGEMIRSDYVDTPPGESGKWLFINHNPANNPNWDKWSSAGEATSMAAGNYAAIFWAALVAAVERDIPGALTAWKRVQAGISNLNTPGGWLDSAADNPRYNRYPRNV